MLRRIQNLNPSRLFNSSTLNLQKLYVGNMPWGMNDESLRNLFAKHGEVSDAFIVRDRLTGMLMKLN
jgi:RNA recognition motif-containing protein